MVLFSYRKIKGLREQFLACNVEYRDGIPYFLNTNIIYPYIDLTSEVYYIQNYKSYSNRYDIEDFEKDFSDYLNEELQAERPFLKSGDGSIEYVEWEVEEFV